jgi:hypothetical protein
MYRCSPRMQEETFRTKKPMLGTSESLRATKMIYVVTRNTLTTYLDFVPTLSNANLCFAVIVSWGHFDKEHLSTELSTPD